MTDEPSDWIGARLRRQEDPRLVRGDGRYVGDLRLPEMLHAGFVRTPYAHAVIRSIDLEPAQLVAGVVAVYSPAELPELGRPIPVSPLPKDLKAHGWYPLATGKVRYLGEPVAVVLSDDPYGLAEAVEAVQIDYEPLEPVVDLNTGGDSSNWVWEDVPGNVATDFTLSFGDVSAAFENADIVVEGRFSFARAAGAALEPRATLAEPAAGDPVILNVWASTQAPHALRALLCSFLRLQTEEVRVITPDVGGGFGPKGRVYSEDIVVAVLALRHRRPVRFVATRTEDLLTTAHGRGQIHHARLAASADGTIEAIEDHVTQDCGAYIPGPPAAAINTARHVLGPYVVSGARVRVTGMYTNKVMTSPLRGGGRPEGIYVVERLLDQLARRLGLDRAEVRRRNFISPGAFPYDTRMPTLAGGTVVYDSGNFPAYLSRALEAIDYASFGARRKRALREGRHLGLGIAAFIESTGVGSEGARVELTNDGQVEVFVGSPSNGQGHATAFAQIAADRLGVAPEAVRVTSGDTARCPAGTGTFASRMGQSGGNAVSLASAALREKLLSLVSDMLEVSPHDLEIVDRAVRVKGVEERRVPLARLAREAASRAERIEVTRTFELLHGNTWAGGVNAAEVEVDVETGHVNILRYVVVHDSGTIINPAIVEGQVHGGVAHGIGNALCEDFDYDAGGNVRAATFADYLILGPGDVPHVEIEHVETPSPFNQEGIKGAGEGGTIAAIPTIVSAVEDALSPFGVTLTDVPIQREDIVWLVDRSMEARL